MNIKKRVNKDLTVGQYDYAGLAHYWAYNYGEKHTAYCRGEGVHRMSCRGNDIYSYRFKLARMYNPIKGRDIPIVLVYNGPCSNATSTHRSAIRAATSSFDTIMVNDINASSRSTHISNLVDIISKITHDIGKRSRARTEHSKESYTYSIGHLIDSAELYILFSSISSSGEAKILQKIKECESGNTLSEEEVNAFLKKQSKIRKAQVTKAQKEKAAKDEARYQTELKEWKFDNGKLPSGGNSRPVELRINGAVIETTQSANISIKSCVEAFRKWKKGDLNIGDTISSFRFGGVVDGVAKVGCHNIDISKIEKLISGEKDERSD